MPRNQNGTTHHNNPRQTQKERARGSNARKTRNGYNNCEKNEGIVNVRKASKEIAHGLSVKKKAHSSSSWFKAFGARKREGVKREGH